MKTLKYLLLVSLIFMGKLLSAQITFQKSYVDATFGELVSLKQTADGGFITLYSGGNDNINLLKLDQYGDISWSKSYGGAGQDVGFDVVETSGGGYIISANSNSFGATVSIYILKTDITGTVIWSKILGGWSGYPHIQQVSNGGYIVCATVDSFGNGFSTADLGLLKIDSAGNLLWSKRYYTPYGDFALSLTQTFDGGYIIGAHSGTYGTDPPDGYMIKTNSTGDIVWEKVLVTPNWYDQINSISQTADSNIIFCSGAYISKMTEYGSMLWNKRFDYSGNRLATITGISQISNGDYLMYGFYYDTITFLIENFFGKLDLNGNPLWTRTIQNGQFINSAGQSIDGGYFFGSSTKQGNKQGYMIKTDVNGYASCEILNETVNVTAVNMNIGNYYPIVSNNISQTNVSTIIGNVSIVISDPCALVITELQAEIAISISPNPFTTELTINQTTPNAQIILLDISGKEILRQKAQQGNTTINTSHLIPGFYILRYHEKNKDANFKVTKF